MFAQKKKRKRKKPMFAHLQGFHLRMVGDGNELMRCHDEMGEKTTFGTWSLVVKQMGIYVLCS